MVLKMKLSPQQKQALAEVKKWIRDPDGPQVFRLFGYAGTGKSTIARWFASTVGGEVMYACFTGKAALVLQEKGCPASTIHRLIYVHQPKSQAKHDDLVLELMELETELEKAEDCSRILQQMADVNAELHAEVERHKQPRFQINLDSDLFGAALLIIDEISMVGTRMAKDLLSFGVKILVLGDPAQLPPVADTGFFIKAEPDFMLTEIHRQSAGSPVLTLATTVREGGELEQGVYGTSRVLPRGVLGIDEVAKFDQILVGRNNTRRDLNRQVRESLGFTGLLPQPGDKIVCLRNDYDQGLLNGSQWGVEDCLVIDEDRIELKISDAHQEMTVQAWRHYFEGRDHELKPWDKRLYVPFDFSYAMTVHKAQGSSWPHVLVIDESSVFRADANKHLYTALTRASVSVTVVQK